MAVGGVDHEHVDAGVDQALGPLQRVGPDADRGADPQATLVVLGRVRVLDLLLDVLDRDEPLEEPLVVDDRQLLDAVLPRMSLACSSVVPSGAVTSGGRRITLAMGWSTSSMKRRSRLVSSPTSRPSPSVIGTPEMWYRSMTCERVGDERLGRQRDRVDDHARLVALDLVDLGDLVVDRQVAVDDADAAGPGDGDGQGRLGDGVHRGRHDGDRQLDRGVRRLAVETSAGSTADSAGTSSTSSNVSPCCANSAGTRPGLRNVVACRQHRRGDRLGLP